MWLGGCGDGRLDYELVLLMDLINFALLSFLEFGHFDTFPDGVRGGLKIKIKVHLSPVGGSRG